MPVEILPHAIPLSLCRAAEAAWPSPDWQYWHRYQGKTADKYGTVDRCRIPPACIAALDALSVAVTPHIGDSFLDYDLHGAGLHMIPSGGFLARHTDAECHPLRPWRRTHSIVMAVNTEWPEEWGGHLWIRGEPEAFLPTQGRAIIFETPGTPHEVLPVDAGCGAYRKTLALFAWTMDAECEGMTYANFGEH